MKNPFNITNLLILCSTVIIFSGMAGTKLAFSCCRNIYECYNVGANSWAVIYYPATAFCTKACTGSLSFKPGSNADIRISKGVGSSSVHGNACFTSNVVCGTLREWSLNMFGCSSYSDTTGVCAAICDGNKTVNCNGDTVTSCQPV